jgi:hypothetical protein
MFTHCVCLPTFGQFNSSSLSMSFFFTLANKRISLLWEHNFHVYKNKFCLTCTSKINITPRTSLFFHYWIIKSHHISSFNLIMRLNSRNDLMHGARHIPLVHHRLGHKNIHSNFVLDIDSNAYTI